MQPIAGSSRLVIVSGGQTGVDRAALDVANELAIPYVGFCPHGGWAEDFPQAPGLLARYPQLRETPLVDPAQRTEWNVRESDAVLILVDRGGVAASQGTALAQKFAAGDRKPLLVLELHQVEMANRWLDELSAARTPEAPLKLGIGDPRESEANGIYVRALAFLHELLRGR